MGNRIFPFISYKNTVETYIEDTKIYWDGGRGWETLRGLFEIEKKVTTVINLRRV
jgi:hypothetical protein